MPIVRLFLGLTLVWGFLAFPFLLIAGIFFEKTAFGVTAGVFVLMALVFLSSCEKLLIYLYRASQMPVVPYSPGDSPRVVIFPDPIPQAFGVRSLWGSGTIFLSQGLVVREREDELRAIIREASLGLEKSGAVLQSACWILGNWVERGTPTAWNSTATVGFWMLFPWLAFFKRSATPRKVDLTVRAKSNAVLVYPIGQM